MINLGQKGPKKAFFVSGEERRGFTMLALEILFLTIHGFREKKQKKDPTWP